MRTQFFILAALVSLISLSTVQAQQGGGGGTQSLQAQGIDAQQAQGGTITGTERFLRENQEIGRVVGGTTEGVGNIRGADSSPAGQTSRGGASQFGRGRNNLNQLFNQFNRNMGRTSQRQLGRIPFELGFPPPAVADQAVITARLQSRLQRIAQVRKMGHVSLGMEGQVAVLRGQVTSAADRDLLARILLMEPGVSDVQNDLTLLQETPPPPVPQLP